MSEVAKQYEFLLLSSRLDASDKAKLRRYLNVDDLRELSCEDDCKDFLKNLTTWLFKHFEREVVLLVDEYDVPLAKAAQFGYYPEMLEMVRSFLGNILKEDPKAESDASTYLLKAVLTGCLRVSKESIFTDVNNFDVNTVCSSDSSFIRRKIDSLVSPKVAQSMVSWMRSRSSSSVKPNASVKSGFVE